GAPRSPRHRFGGRGSPSHRRSSAAPGRPRVVGGGSGEVPGPPSPRPVSSAAGGLPEPVPVRSQSDRSAERDTDGRDGGRPASDAGGRRNHKRSCGAGGGRSGYGTPGRDREPRRGAGRQSGREASRL